MHTYKVSASILISINIFIFLCFIQIQIIYNFEEEIQEIT